VYTYSAVPLLPMAQKRGWTAGGADADEEDK